MERPNTVAGLQAKRKELRQQIKKLIKAVRTLDAALLVFDEFGPYKKAPGRYAERYQFVLDYLRTATGPVTVPEVTASWIAHKGFILDANQKNEMRRRVRVTFGKLHAAGTVALVGEVNGRKAWRLT